MKSNKSIRNQIISIIIGVLSFSCNNYPETVKEALNSMDHQNRKKFEGVLDYYDAPKDSLKLQAAYRLISNISDQGYYDGKQIRDYNVIFDILRNKPDDFRDNLPWYSDQLFSLFDSLNTIYGKINNTKLYFVKDEDSFTAESFIHYIESAFLAWDEPWSKRNVSFDAFCNYVLPYRNFNEPLEFWRPLFKQRFDWIYDSLNGNEDLIEVARILNTDTELKYSEGFSNYTLQIAPSNLLKAVYGGCIDNSNYKAMIMRAYGIPVAIDFFPQYGNDHNSHYWNSIMDSNGNFESFEEALNDINASVAYKYRIAKVFRRVQHKNPSIVELQKDMAEYTPLLFQDSRITDVTRGYIPVRDVQFKISNGKNFNYLFLGVFNNKDWTIIDFAPVKNDMAYFSDLGKNIIYMPLTITNGKIEFFDFPFKISEKGFIQYLRPDSNPETVVLTRKYHFHKRKNNWLKCLKGGRFQGANTPDFKDGVTLAIIDRIPSEHGSLINVKCDIAFKYYRFLFSSDELLLPYDGDGASIAEIEFTDRIGEILKGIPIGSEGKKYNSYTPDLCFDNNPLTFFEDSRPGSNDKYVGLQLSQPKKIISIRYVPRNDMNSIQPGDKYELYYCTNSGFISLGQKIARDTVLLFDNAPQGAVLWLRDLSRGNEERIFLWENGRQVWY